MTREEYENAKYLEGLRNEIDAILQYMDAEVGAKMEALQNGTEGFINLTIPASLITIVNEMFVNKKVELDVKFETSFTQKASVPAKTDTIEASNVKTATVVAPNTSTETTTPKKKK